MLFYSCIPVWFSKVFFFLLYCLSLTHWCGYCVILLSESTDYKCSLSGRVSILHMTKHSHLLSMFSMLRAMMDVTLFSQCLIVFSLMLFQNRMLFIHCTTINKYYFYFFLVRKNESQCNSMLLRLQISLIYNFCVCVCSPEGLERQEGE